MKLDKLTTETRNEASMALDQMSVQEAIALMNQEDRRVPEAIEQVLPQIEAAIKLIVKSFKQDSRLIYMGAGTSGRLGVLYAAE